MDWDDSGGFLQTFCTMNFERTNVLDQCPAWGETWEKKARWFPMLCYLSFSSQGFHNNSFRVSGMHWPPASFARCIKKLRNHLISTNWHKLTFMTNHFRFNKRVNPRQWTNQPNKINRTMNQSKPLAAQKCPRSPHARWRGTFAHSCSLAIYVTKLPWILMVCSWIWGQYT